MEREFFMATMTTPYGTTTFALGEPSWSRWLHVNEVGLADHLFVFESQVDGSSFKVPSSFTFTVRTDVDRGRGLA